MATSKLLEVRMTEKEYEEVRDLAKRCDLDMSKFVRVLIRKAKKQLSETGELTISVGETV